MLNPYDSISQIFFCAYAESDDFRQSVDECSQLQKIEDCALYFEFIKNALRDGLTVQAYRKRAQVLISIEDFAQMKLGDTVTVDTACNVIYLIDKLFAKHPSYTEERTCSKCNHVPSRSVTTINVNLPTDNLIFLNDALTSNLTDVLKCRACSHILDRTINTVSYTHLTLPTIYSV